MRPRLVNLATARGWASGGAWSHKAIGALLGDASLTVKRSTDAPHFMYTAAGRDGEILPDQAAPSETCAMAARDFLDAIAGQHGPPYLYYTAPVAEHAGLLERAPGWAELATLTGEAADELPMACRPWMQWWAGSGGATTQAHYDVADNLFVQLHGHKEFWLYPPGAACGLHLFPDAHPRARKSQVALERRNSNPTLSLSLSRMWHSRAPTFHGLR